LCSSWQRSTTSSRPIPVSLTPCRMACRFG
jgi:hypothetical protein